MAAPQYGFSNYFGTSDPGGDILTLIENQLTNTEWVFVEQVAFTQASLSRVMRVWKNPAAVNAAGVDFYIGLVKNAAAGTYLAIRCFEGWNTTTKTMQRPCLTGGATLNALWSAVTYGGTNFVAVANSTTSSTAATSPDGVSWTSRPMPPTATSWTGVAYGGGTFVAIATGTNIAATSTDGGVTWTARTLPANVAWTAVAYGGGTFVAVASATAIAASSPDGITWTQRAMPANTTWASVAYGGTSFVAVSGSTGAAAYSSNGATWTSSTLPAATTYGLVAYGNGTFVAISGPNSGSNSAAAYSTNGGVSWTSSTMSSSQVWGGLAYGNGVFAATNAATTGGIANTSPDGITWTARTQTSGYITATTFGAGVFATVAGNSAATAAIGSQTSPDGITWTLGKGMGLASAVALGDYAVAGSTQPLLCEGNITLVVTTNYDVGVLVSKSYLAVGINLNGTGTVRYGRVVGLFSPAYADSVTTNLPLMSLDLAAAAQALTSGVSRSMRVPIDSNGVSTFGIGAGPESLLVGSFSGATKEPVSQSIRGSRVALVAGSSNLTAFAATGGMRGWLYDCMAVATSTATGVKVSDTVTVGATVWTNLSASVATANTGIATLPFGYFFNVTTGS